MDMDISFKKCLATHLCVVAKGQIHFFSYIKLSDLGCKTMDDH